MTAPAAQSRVIALAVELTADAEGVHVIGHRKSPAGVEFEEPLPNHLLAPEEALKLVLQLAQAGVVQQARLTPDGVRVWGPLQGEYWVRPSAVGEGNGRPAKSRLIRPAEA